LGLQHLAAKNNVIRILSLYDWIIGLRAQLACVSLHSSFPPRGACSSSYLDRTSHAIVQYTSILSSHGRKWERNLVDERKERKWDSVFRLGKMALLESLHTSPFFSAEFLAQFIFPLPFYVEEKKRNISRMFS